MLHTFSPGAYVCALEKSTEGRLPYLRHLAAGLIRGRTTVKERACMQAACARKVAFRLRKSQSRFERNLR